MNISFALKIFFEIGLVLLIAYGYKNEDKLIAFENELFPVLKFAFRKYVLGKKSSKAYATKKPSNEYIGISISMGEALVKPEHHSAIIKKFPQRMGKKENVA